MEDRIRSKASRSEARRRSVHHHRNDELLMKSQNTPGGDPRLLVNILTDKFKDGWASGSMECRKCGSIFRSVRFRYSCHDKVEGVWPRCCGELTKFGADWEPEQ
jgi:hypothetical protein